MNSQEIYDSLKNVGAFLQNGHFVYSHGLHGEDYIPKYELFKHPALTAEITENFIPLIKHLDIDTVIGPEKGGIYLSQWVAYWLSKYGRKDIVAVSAYKWGKQFRVRPEHYADIKNRRVLVVEDVLTTGLTAKLVTALVRQRKGTNVGIAALCDRGELAAESLGVS